ncbi:MAG: hypothetical protein WCX32_02680 [Clostridia bacterium]|nr:hypothetical protein [Clostridia bacterium]MDD4275733.1 hypothetical protein [Clostridia bacterium]
MDPIIQVLLVALGLYLVYALISILVFKRKHSAQAKKSKIIPTKAETNILTKKSKEKVKALKSSDIIVEMRPPTKAQTGVLEINVTNKPEQLKTEILPAEIIEQKAEDKRLEQPTSIKLADDKSATYGEQPLDTPIYELQPIVADEIIKNYDGNAVSSEEVIEEVEESANKSLNQAVSSKKVIEEVEKDINETLQKFDDKNVDDAYSTTYLETDEATGLEDYNGQEDTELDITIMDDNNQFFDEFTDTSPVIKTILFGDILNKKQ